MSFQGLFDIRVVCPQNTQFDDGRVTHFFSAPWPPDDVGACCLWALSDPVGMSLLRLDNAYTADSAEVLSATKKPSMSV